MYNFLGHRRHVKGVVTDTGSWETAIVAAVATRLFQIDVEISIIVLCSCILVFTLSVFPHEQTDSLTLIIL